MTETPTITLEDISAQVRDLSRLLAVIRDDTYELDYGSKCDSPRKHMLDRIKSLLSIACETAERTADQIEENYHAIHQAPVMVPAIPDEVLEIGSEILALHEKLNRRREAAGKVQ